MDLMTKADDVVRSLLPVALEAAGSGRQAESLRGLPRVRDAGTAAMACGRMRAVRPFLHSECLERAVRLCEEAVCAALAGDAGRFGLYVREAAGRIRAAHARGPSN